MEQFYSCISYIGLRGCALRALVCRPLDHGTQAQSFFLVLFFFACLSTVGPWHPGTKALFFFVLFFFTGLSIVGRWHPGTNSQKKIKKIEIVFKKMFYKKMFYFWRGPSFF
jgi:hypothetical protein